MSFVLDNTIAIAWCFEAEQTPPIMSLLERVTETGAVVPLLWPLEALNVLLMAERRKRIGATERDRLAGFLQRLPVSLDGTTARPAWDEGKRLAQQHRLTL